MIPTCWTRQSGPLSKFENAGPIIWEKIRFKKSIPFLHLFSFQIKSVNRKIFLKHLNKLGMFKATSSKYIYRFLNTPVSIFRLFLSRINLRKKGDENKSH